MFCACSARCWGVHFLFMSVSVLRHKKYLRHIFFLLPAVFLFFLFQLCQLYTKRLFDDLFIFKKRFFFWCYSVFPSFYSTGKVTKNELAAGLPLRF